MQGSEIYFKPRCLRYSSVGRPPQHGAGLAYLAYLALSGRG
jgi:hypothetical protein